MKAVIVGRRNAANVNDFVHGGGTYVRSLVFEQLNGLCIHVIDGQLYAFTGLNLDMGRYDRLGEVEVPQELIDKAMKVAKVYEILDRVLSEVSDIISEIDELTNV